jgi:DNA polymerase-3 subunit delta'
MNLEALKGNDALKRRLQGHELSHAYIVSGADSSKREALANILAQAMVCSGDGEKPCGVCRDCRKASEHIHPDIATVQRDAKSREIVVAQIRDMCADAAIMPNEAEKKVYIINEAGTMNTEAQNALLKTLEEPPKHVSIILTAENAAKLLPTVRSRCVSLYLEDESAASDDTEAKELADKFISAAEHRSSMEAVTFMAAFENIDKTTAADFIELSERAAAEKIRHAPANAGIYFRLTDIIKEARVYLDHEVGTGHISGMLSAGLMKCIRNEGKN